MTAGAMDGAMAGANGAMVAEIAVRALVTAGLASYASATLAIQSPYVSVGQQESRLIEAQMELQAVEFRLGLGGGPCSLRAYEQSLERRETLRRELQALQWSVQFGRTVRNNPMVMYVSN